MVKSVYWKGERLWEILSSWQEVLGGFPLLVVPAGRCDLTDFLVSWHNSSSASQNEKKTTNEKAEFLSCFNSVWLEELMTDEARRVQPDKGLKVTMQAGRTIAGSRQTLQGGQQTTVMLWGYCLAHWLFSSTFKPARFNQQPSSHEF